VKEQIALSLQSNQNNRIENRAVDVMLAFQREVGFNFVFQHEGGKR
jgi:hypothetical protein